jgi:hypothetical protein
MKKGKKTRRTDNIDDFLEKALAKPQQKRASKALVRADMPKEPAVAEPTNTMIPLNQGEAMFARLEERKRAKERAQELIAPPLAPRLLERDEEPEEVYEEDFEEEPPEPPKKPLRPATPLALKKAQPEESKLRMSVDEINRLVEKDTLEARKREEEENKALELKLQAQKPAQMVVQKSASTAPKQLEQKTKKAQEKRNFDLMEILQFESFSEGIFDLQSTNEYDDMMRKLQRNEAKNSSTQWNDDYLERECQTNDVEMAEKQTQWPEDLNVVKGTKGTSGINRFLKRFLPTVEAVLEENVGGKGRGVKLAGEQSTVKYVASSLTLQVPQDLVAARYAGLPGRVAAVAFFAQKTSLVAVCSVLGTETLVWIWDLQSNRPAKVLRACDIVTSLCIPSGSDYIVVCGTAIGSLLLWDLRESGFNHPTVQTDSQTYYLREPTYSTEALPDSGHTGSIDRLMELQQSDNRNFQVASLDSTGNLLSWSVIELPTADEAGSELDLGLRINGRMKLIRGSSAYILSNLKQREADCASLAFDPSNNQ